MNGADIVGGILYGMVAAMPPGACDPRGVCHPWYVPPGTIIQHVQPRMYPDGEPPYYPGQPVSPDWGMAPAPQQYNKSYVCTPGYDPTDRNPPRSIGVTVHMVINIAHTMEVTFYLVNGNIVNRSQQYDATMSPTPGQGIIAGWTGNLRRDPSQHMAGGLFYGQDQQWHYREKLWSHGRPDWDYTAPCTPYDGGE